MLDVKIADKDLLSHQYLNELVNQQGLADFKLNANTLSPLEQTDAKNGAPLSKLIIFTEGLHLQQLQQVSEALSEVLDIAFFRVIKVAGLQGFAVSAHVTVNIKNTINQQLETVANRFSVELCLIDKAPELSKPGLLLMDMDSTVIAVECIDEIAILAGVGEEVSAVTAQAMQGKLDFAQSLRSRVACLKNADELILQQVRTALPLMPGVANLVSILKSFDWKVAIASGGFSYFADYLQDRLNLDAAVANDLEIHHNKLTGQVQGAIIDANAKAETLNTLAEKWSITPEQTIAMGDGANDLVMMNTAALGVALHAKPVVRENADIAIRRGGLDSLLWVLAASEN